MSDFSRSSEICGAAVPGPPGLLGLAPNSGRARSGLEKLIFTITCASLSYLAGVMNRYTRFRARQAMRNPSVVRHLPQTTCATLRAVNLSSMLAQPHLVDRAFLIGTVFRSEH